MKVVVDAMLLGGKHSGVEVSIEGLCGSLGQAADEHEWLIAHRASYDARGLRAGHVETLAAPDWADNRVGRIVWERFVLPRLARQWGADLLHGPGYLIPPGWRGPSVVTVYDILALSHPEWCKGANALHYRVALPQSIRRASAVIVPSQTVAAEVVSHVGIQGEKLHVVPLGLAEQMRPADEEQIRAVRQRHKLPERYVLWVGNLEPKKNVEQMVRAFELVSDRVEQDFVIAGRTGWKAEESLRAIAESPAAARLHRLGYVASEELPALYSGADLLVHWSLYEGAGLTPLEAMACGTPAIVSDGGALGELAGQQATVVPLGDPADLAAAMVELLGDAARRDEAGRAGREWASQFTWGAYADRVIGIYEEAAGLSGQT